MTEKKISKTKKKVFNMQESWKALSPIEQEKVTNFFNAHNLAHLLYTLAEEETQKYISSCIMMQRDADKKENENV